MPHVDNVHSWKVKAKATRLKGRL